MASSFYAPENFTGKSIFDLQKEGLLQGRPDLIAGLLGVEANQPFSANQQFNVAFEPGHEGSLEKKSITGGFTPGATFQQQQAEGKAAEIKANEQAFLDRFKTQFPEIITGLEEELQLPGLRNTAFQQNQRLEEIPGMQEQAARGRDISANQLERIIAAKVAKQGPIAQKATAQAQFAGQQFATRLGQELTPFQMESEFLSSQSDREFQLIKAQIEGQLSRDLQELQNLNSQQIQQMANSGALDQLIKKAELESTVENLKFVDLGDKIGIFNEQTGEMVSSQPKGKLGTLSDQSGW